MRAMTNEDNRSFRSGPDRETTPRILVIDDESAVCDSIANVLERRGYLVTTRTKLDEGIRAARAGAFDVVLLDVKFPEGDGLSAISTIRNTETSPEVVIMTGFGDPGGAEAAIQHGAWDYLQKPASARTIAEVAERALSYQERKGERQRRHGLQREEIIGDSNALRDALELLAQAASSDIPTLITGESGTGKELFAWTIHRNSERARRNFVVVDCTALPETLIESILFGSERGAYTGADRAREGLIAQADGGTLFLDEVGDLPLVLQKKFLRVLQERTVRPLGASKEKSADFRLVAATNRDLDRMVEQGQFRQDLLFRLQSLRIVLPLLRQRRSDIRPLAEHYLGELSQRYQREITGVSDDFFAILQQYDWPGNVRELHQALEKAVIAAGSDGELFSKDLPRNIRAAVARESVAPETEERQAERAVSRGEAPPRSLKAYREEVLERAERQYLTDLLLYVNYDMNAACAISELSRSRLYSLLKKYDVPTRPGDRTIDYARGDEDAVGRRGRRTTRR